MAKHKWDAIISDLESSGLNPNQYAARHQISKTSLYYHLRKRRETAKQRVDPRGLVHEVKLSELKVYTKRKRPSRDVHRQIGLKRVIDLNKLGSNHQISPKLERSEPDQVINSLSP